jgi:hypothetical protein
LPFIALQALTRFACFHNDYYSNIESTISHLHSLQIRFWPCYDLWLSLCPQMASLGHEFFRSHRHSFTVLILVILSHSVISSDSDCGRSVSGGCSAHFVIDEEIRDDSSFTLSVVAASRNDDFGRGSGSCNANVADGHPLDAEVLRSANEGLSAVDRTFNWVDVWACMALRHRVSLELVLVDWATDTSSGRLPLVRVFANRNGGRGIHFCNDTSLEPQTDIVLRIITVPPSFANSVPNEFNLTMLEHHAKNVGLRRARGRWLLVNNPDTLPSPDIMPFVKKANNQWPQSSAAFYRAHRMALSLSPTIALAPTLPADVRMSRLERMLELSLVSNSASLETDDSASDWEGNVLDTDSYGWDYPIILGDDSCLDGPPILNMSLTHSATIDEVLHRLGPSRQIYSMASGDFVMMSRQAMRAVGGYIQVAQNWNMDSFMLCQAIGTGLHQVILSLPCAVIHQYHPRTRYYSSFSKQMFPEFSDNIVTHSGICNRMLCMGGKYHMNDANCVHKHDTSHSMGWGFPDENFDDFVM